jgi:hypothetical protein
MLIYIPIVLNDCRKRIFSTNPLHDGVRKLSGNKLAATSSDFNIQDIKMASKKLNVTINDLMTSALCAGVKQYFEKKGDMYTTKINIAIPTSMRFKHYETLKELKLENCWTPYPLTVPLYSDL